jgi:hypothetical protein
MKTILDNFDILDMYMLMGEGKAEELVIAGLEREIASHRAKIAEAEAEITHRGELIAKIKAEQAAIDEQIPF